MAAVLRIENYAATTYVDLLGSDIVIVRGSGAFAVNPEDTQTTTVFSLLFNASTAAGIRTDYNELVALLDQATKWHKDDLESESVWLRWAADGETAKRSLIYDYAIRNNAGVALDPMQLLSSRLAVDLAITHDAEAEDVTAFTAALIYAGLDSYDFYSLYSGATAKSTGSRGGRIVSFYSPPAAGHTVDKFWVGLRPVATYAGFSNMELVWPLEDAGTYGTGTAYATEAGSYGTQVLEVDFATGGGSAALAMRARLSVEDYITGANTSMLGGYQVLLRYKLEASTDVAVRAGISESSAGYQYAAYNSMQYDLTADAAWHWLELGYMRFPPSGKRAAKETIGVDIGQLSVWLQAERISGTGSLFMDCVQLIPYEHFISVDGLYKFSAGDQYYYTTTHENGVTESFVNLVDDTVNSIGNVASINDWRIPENTPLFIVAYAIEEAAVAGLPGATDMGRSFLAIQRKWAGYNGG